MAYTDYTDASPPTGSTSELAATGPRGLNAITAEINAKQAGDADLTAIAGLAPTNDDVIQRKSGAWANRTMAQLKTDLALQNVDNTSDATKNAATGTLTNKTIAWGSNTITGLPTTALPLEIPRVLLWSGTAWPDRPGDLRPTLFIGGSAATDAPADADLRAGDVWIPATA